jgi:hypothetical protein
MLPDSEIQSLLNTFSDSEGSDTSAQISVIDFVIDDVNNIDDSLAVIEGKTC